MVNAKYVRKKATINNLSEGSAEVFKSINAAKRQSAKLQQAEDGALGRGILKVHWH